MSYQLNDKWSLGGNLLVQSGRLADFCGLAFDPSLLEPHSGRAVVTASAVQVRNRIQVRERPKWAPYEAWLAPMIDRLGA